MAFKPNVNFGASNVIDPTAGARQALQSVGGLLDDYNKRQQSTQEMLLREQGRQDALAQQALANTRADEQLRMQQVSAQQSTDAINRGLEKEEATKNLFTNVPKNTLDPYMDSLSAQYTEGKMAEQQANLAAGGPLLTKYKGATDAENALGMKQGAATQEQRNQVATLKDKVLDPADYRNRMFDASIASGLGIDASVKIADQVYKQNAIETPKANTDLIKMETDMAEASYKAEYDRLNTLLNVSFKDDKSGKSEDGYTGNAMKDQVKLIEKVQLMAPNTDWNIFGKDYGGEDIAPMIVDKMRDNKLTAPQMEVALLLAKEGVNDALLNKDVEFSGSKLDKAIELVKADPDKYAYSDKTSAGINTALYNSSMDALNKARDKTNAELQKRMASTTATAVQPTQAAYEKQIRESIFGAPKADNLQAGAVIKQIPQEQADKDYYAKQAKWESSNNYTAANKNADGVVTAYGKGQFTKDTARDISKQLGLKWVDGKDWTQQEWTTPANQDLMVRRLDYNNSQVLNDAKVPLTELNRYGAHQQGATGYLELLGNVTNGKPLTPDRMDNIRSNLPNNGKGVADKDLGTEWMKVWGEKFDSTKVPAETVFPGVGAPPGDTATQGSKVAGTVTSNGNTGNDNLVSDLFAKVPVVRTALPNNNTAGTKAIDLRGMLLEGKDAPDAKMPAHGTSSEAILSRLVNPSGMTDEEKAYASLAADDKPLEDQSLGLIPGFKVAKNVTSVATTPAILRNATNIRKAANDTRFTTKLGESTKAAQVTAKEQSASRATAAAKKEADDIYQNLPTTKKALQDKLFKDALKEEEKRLAAEVAEKAAKAAASKAKRAAKKEFSYSLK